MTIQYYLKWRTFRLMKQLYCHVICYAFEISFFFVRPYKYALQVWIGNSDLLPVDKYQYDLALHRKTH